LLDEKNRLYQQFKKMLTSWLNKHMNKVTSIQRVCFNSMLQTDMFGESSMDISKIASYMECSERTARKILADAGPLLTTTKDGRKIIWHINLDTLASEEN